MSKIEVDTIDTQSSTTLQVGDTNTALIKIGKTGDTVEYPAGTTFTQSGTQNVTSGGVINVKSGGNITIDSGATITNNGTASGFSADLTNLNATNLTSGTVPNARYGTPTFSGANLTNLNATALTSGTIPAARISSLPAGVGGKVLQVLTATDSTQRSTTSTSFVTASNTLSVDITPSATSSKVLIMISTVIGNNTEEAQAISTIYRASTNLGDSTKGMLDTYHFGGTTRQSASLIFLDSPSSTSQLTYQLYVRGTGGTTEINYNGGKGSIIVMEIGA